MKSRKGLVLAGIAALALVLFLPVSSWAYTYFMDFNGTGGGSISYAGNSNPLIGTNIPISSVYGQILDDTGTIVLYDSGVREFSDSGILSFATGNNISGTWTWGGLGSISISGSVGDITGPLMTGQVTDASVSFQFGIGRASEMLLAVSRYGDDKNPDLLDLLFKDSGYPVPVSSGWTGALSVMFIVPGNPQIGSPFASSTVSSIDANNTLTFVPLPSGILLLGSGLIGFLGVRRIKR